MLEYLKTEKGKTKTKEIKINVGRWVNSSTLFYIAMHISRKTKYTASEG